MRTLATWCFRRRRTVLLAWLVLAIGGTALSSSVGTNFNTGFSLKGVDSTRAIALLQRSAPGLRIQQPDSDRRPQRPRD